ncbi:pyridoxamine 5'-phosphate oxidase family protein [Rubrimonas cliftonensis]|uniref:Pyridoxamine 5'-phosphate oxidase N-terminal domain-containing protein n=1 Tax=Rubrimonas cliftonensis TaxID=89524 RepID=A0A1H4C2R6_9RHOB|nr:pyridoxamine 5'-phosphate oxidase family protein [Rubrimonas cliftonensis]SEA54372.1 hypothetical protein SAMN05444370_106161 [Rubrimonas cliftonensis]
MQFIDSVEALQALYGDPVPAALTKVAREITPAYRRWIEASRFLVIATVGPEGVDASPRGDSEPVVRIEGATTLLLPDWRGNNRIDTLRNIVRDPRVSLMFMVPGSDNVVRVIGAAQVTADDGTTALFERDGRRPRTVLVVTAAELYFQCAKALMRSRLWSSPDESAGLPTAGQFLREATPGFDGESYDSGYPAQAREKMW